MTRRPQVLVIGDSADYPDRNETARILGRFIAEQGWVLISGGRGGVMAAASRGAQEGCGISVAILPSDRMEEANPWADIVIPTGIGFARNYTNTLAADVVVSIGGGTGTLCEIAYAWQANKPIIACSFTGGWSAELAGRTLDYRRTDAIMDAHSIEETMQYLRTLLQPRQPQ
ncbi:MAG TPA: TIGR00725 family protein [Spirochaetota bacterium]|nr:TIGR00725 family protein [Spirochaetota bacterium]